MLTKTAYLGFLQCSKRFWLARYEPDLAAAPGPAARRRLRAGDEVDALAREQFPGGVLIPYRPRPQEMAQQTARALAAGAETLYQATFTVDDLLVRADILTKTATGWHLIEVKSGTSYKRDEHLPDVAFQLLVLEQAGLNLSQVSLMHLNNKCRYPDLSNLFVLTDVTGAARAFLPQVAEDVGMMRGLAGSADSPDVNIGRYCTRPHTCPFHAHCWQDVDGWTIYDIPYLKRPLEQQLEASGIRDLTDVPSDFTLGDKRADAFVTRVRQQQISIARDAIHASLDKLVYPLYFLDFETIDQAVPVFAGCKPYQQVPFQFSCHILQADGTLTHCEYLHTDATDPRPDLAEALLNYIGNTGHLIAYHVPFERGILRHLAAHLPAHATRLQHMADRLWDQLIIFRKHYHHYQFGKSNSLKAVLPVVVPELSYQTLAVQEGTQAQVAWEEMIRSTKTAVKKELAESLQAYCHLDTLAMVKIHQALHAL